MLWREECSHPANLLLGYIALRGTGPRATAKRGRLRGKRTRYEKNEKIALRGTGPRATGEKRKSGKTSPL